MAANEIETALDQAVAVLQGGVERPGMERALRVIETWEQRLAASESPELLPVADNLAALRIQLLAGDADPAAVGQLLLTLGEQVWAVAESDVGAPVADRLSQLSDLLRNQGNALANRERAQQPGLAVPPLQRASSQFCPTSSLPKLWCSSSSTSSNPCSS